MKNQEEVTLLNKLKNDPDNLEYNLSLWSKMIGVQRANELIEHAKTVYYRSLRNGDDTLRTFSAAYIAQAYLILNQLDSIPKYLNYVDVDLIKANTRLTAIYHNVSASYAMKIQLDYTKAVKGFLEIYKIMKEEKHVYNQISVLSNIVSVYYVRKDMSGLAYAQEAYNLNLKAKYPYFDIHTNLDMAKMLYLSTKTDDALVYLSKAEKFANEYDMKAYLPNIYKVYGDIYNIKSNYKLADKYYKLAVKESLLTDSGTRIEILLSAADYSLSKLLINEAVTLYTDALNLSYQTKDVEYRQSILRGLSDASFIKNDKYRALEYYRNSHRFADTILTRNKEIEFNRMLLDYERANYENLMRIKDLDLKNAQRTVVISVLIFFIAVSLIISLIVYIKKRNKMYKELVERHQKYFNRTNFINQVIDSPNESVKSNNTVAANISDENTLLPIFIQIENSLKKNKLYKDKDFSLDSLAEYLCTNRTYISKAINSYANTNFYNYINTFRMDEATKILSDISYDAPLRSLAEELGYNSQSAFYRAFQKEIGCSPSRYREEVLKQKKKEEK